MKCNYCLSENIIKSGVTLYKKQRYYCKTCKKKSIEKYTYNAYKQNINHQITVLTKEGLGIRSTARVLKISTTTLLKRIIQIAKEIKQPIISYRKNYRVDELRTYIGNKKNAIWIIYAIDSATKHPVCFKVGKRNKKNLKMIIETIASNINR